MYENYYAILNIKEWKLLELQITQTRNHLSICNKKNVLVQDTPKMKQLFMKCA